MNELKGFVKGLKVLGYEMVSVGDVFDDDFKCVKISGLVGLVKELGIEEVVAEYDESFEFIDKSGKYIEVCGVC